MKILVIDDDALMVDIIVSALESAQFNHILSAQSGQDALDILLTNDVIDVIICDLQMPGMDGIQFLRNLASIQYPGGIILLSGEDEFIISTAEILSNAHKLNTLGSIKKPASADALAALINNYKRNKDILSTKKIPLDYGIDFASLRAALDKGEFVMFYQPKVSYPTQKIVGFEALARWNHPKHGLIHPEEFIPLLESHKLIDEFSLFAFKSVATEGKKLIAHQDNLKLSVNLSMDNMDRLDLPDVLEEITLSNGLHTNQFIIEITESRLINNLTTALDILARIRLKGFLLSIDDFGTGYSSLAQLKKIPFLELKIDKAFVHDAGKNRSSKTILKSSVELAKNLNLTTVCEGVENQRDWDLLTSMGVDCAQGFFIAKPMPAENVEDWITEWNKKHPEN